MDFFLGTGWRGEEGLGGWGSLFLLFLLLLLLLLLSFLVLWGGGTARLVGLRSSSEVASLWYPESRLEGQVERALRVGNIGLLVAM